MSNIFGSFLNYLFASAITSRKNASAINNSHVQIPSRKVTAKSELITKEKAYLERVNTQIDYDENLLDLYGYPSSDLFGYDDEMVEFRFNSDEKANLVSRIEEDQFDEEARMKLIELLISGLGIADYPGSEVNPDIVEIRYNIHWFLKHHKDSSFRTMCLRSSMYAIDGQIYLYEHNLQNALKRYFSAINWEEMLAAVYCTNSFDLNGTEGLYWSILGNIINIYALANQKDKADEVRNAFSRGLFWKKWFVNNIDYSKQRLIKHVQFEWKALQATTKPIGIWTILEYPNFSRSAISSGENYCFLGDFFCQSCSAYEDDENKIFIPICTTIDVSAIDASLLP